MFILASFPWVLRNVYHTTTVGFLTDSEFWIFIHEVDIFTILIV